MNDIDGAYVSKQILEMYKRQKRDTVEVVRCKGCEYWGDENGRFYTADDVLDRCKAHSYFRYGKYIGWFPSKNDFCSCGKRREK